jgi:hypothetical protein
MYKVTSVSFIQEDPYLIKKFQMSSRNLWNDHAWRIRNYIVSHINSTADLETATLWVVENIGDLANVVKLYYGDEAADKFSGILKRIVDRVVVKLQMAKSGESVSSMTDEDMEPLNDLAVFLDTANPMYWKKEVVLPILQKIFALWINQILARIAGEWNMDLQYTDEIHEHLLKLADIFSAGIIGQFPNSFSSGDSNVLQDV